MERYIIYDIKKDEIRDESGNVKGKRPEPKKKHAVARCTNKIHPMDMSAPVVRKHECLNRKGGICPFMVKYEHEYWAQRERKKAKKKAA